MPPIRGPEGWGPPPRPVTLAEQTRVAGLERVLADLRKAVADAKAFSESLLTTRTAQDQALEYDVNIRTTIEKTYDIAEIRDTFLAQHPDLPQDAMFRLSFVHGHGEGSYKNARGQLVHPVLKVTYDTANEKART